MSDAPSLVAVIGSLRRESFTRTVFEAATELVPDGTTLVEAPVRDVPFYDQDVDDAGAPEPVRRLQETVRDAHGVIFFTPEYNRSIPAVTKNAVDWLSRPYGDAPIREAVAGIVAVVPGRHSGEGVRAHLGDTIGVLTTNLYAPSLGISSIRHRVVDGALADDEAIAELQMWLDGFAAFARERALVAD